jgi:hypothetical protein
MRYKPGQRERICNELTVSYMHEYIETFGELDENALMEIHRKQKINTEPKNVTDTRMKIYQKFYNMKPDQLYAIHCTRFKKGTKEYLKRFKKTMEENPPTEKDVSSENYVQSSQEFPDLDE